MKLADKICNLRDILASPRTAWSLGRRQKYFDWATEVVDHARGVDPELERMFDRLQRRGRWVVFRRRCEEESHDVHSD